MTGHPDKEGDRHDRPRHQLGLSPRAEARRLAVAQLLSLDDDEFDAVLQEALVAKDSYGATVSTGAIPADASTGVPRAPVEVRPAGGATGPTPAAPPAHHLRLTRWQRVLQRLLDLIGRPADDPK